MSDDRRLAVLRAIVQDFVASEEPVGSKGLVDRHDLGVSSATVRNDMAVLEEEGFIAQPPPAPVGSPRIRDTGCLWIGWLICVLSRRPKGARSSPFLTAQSIWTMSSDVAPACWHS